MLQQGRQHRTGGQAAHQRDDVARVNLQMLVQLGPAFGLLRMRGASGSVGSESQNFVEGREKTGQAKTDDAVERGAAFDQVFSGDDFRGFWFVLLFTTLAFDGDRGLGLCRSDGEHGRAEGLNYFADDGGCRLRRQVVVPPVEQRLRDRVRLPFDGVVVRVGLKVGLVAGDLERVRNFVSAFFLVFVLGGRLVELEQLSVVFLQELEELRILVFQAGQITLLL